MTSAGNSNNYEGVEKHFPEDYGRIANLTTKHLTELEAALSRSNLCSLTFLLADKHKDEIVLEDLYHNLLTDDIHTISKLWPFRFQGLIQKWIQPSAEPNWREKIIEALLVTQNFGVLKKWQLDVNNLKMAFESPSKWYSVHINPVRKLLYLLCDDLSEDDWRTLSTAVNIEKNMSKDDKQQYGLEFPEISLLHWSSKQIINIKSINESNISIIEKHLVHIKRDDWVAILSELSQDSRFFIKKIHANHIKPISAKTMDPEDQYKIDRPNAGVCLIFNQELIEGFDEPREGTKNDAEYLEETFKCFGFEVKVRNNIKASGITHQICYFSQEPMSCYVIAILSHGERDFVKGSDGGDVNINEIESTLLRIKSLENKPKLLLIQACQADPSYSNDIAIDTGRKGHLFVYMAALPGDVAYRHKVLGSFFINHLCDTLLENCQHANWTEIIRICNAKMEKEKFAYLMPWHRCAFTKHLILEAKSPEAAMKVLKNRQKKREEYISKRS